MGQVPCGLLRDLGVAVEPMADVPLSPVVSSQIASAKTSKPSFDASIGVPVRTERNLRQPLHLLGMSSIYSEELVVVANATRQLMGKARPSLPSVDGEHHESSSRRRLETPPRPTREESRRRYSPRWNGHHPLQVRPALKYVKPTLQMATRETHTRQAQLASP